MLTIHFPLLGVASFALRICDRFLNGTELLATLRDSQNHHSIRDAFHASLDEIFVNACALLVFTLVRITFFVYVSLVVMMCNDIHLEGLRFIWLGSTFFSLEASTSVNNNCSVDVD